MADMDSVLDSITADIKKHSDILSSLVSSQAESDRQVCISYCRHPPLRDRLLFYKVLGESLEPKIFHFISPHLVGQ